MKRGEAILVGLIAGGAIGAGVGFIIANRGSNRENKSHDGEGMRAGAVLTTLGAALSAIGGTMLLSERKLISPTTT